MLFGVNSQRPFSSPADNYSSKTFIRHFTPGYDRNDLFHVAPVPGGHEGRPEQVQMVGGAYSEGIKLTWIKVDAIGVDAGFFDRRFFEGAVFLQFRCHGHGLWSARPSQTNGHQAIFVLRLKISESLDPSRQ